jgi:cytoskeleton protein RodZ
MLEPETRVPSGAIILVSILLAAVVYGSWYRFSMEGREDMEIVTDVPERMMGYLRDEAPPPQEPLRDQEEKLAAEDAHDDRFFSEDETENEVGGNAGDDIAGESPAQDAGEDSMPLGAASGEAPSVMALEEGVVITYFDEFGREYVAEYGESPLAPIFADHVPAEDISGEASNFQFVEMEDSEEATLLSPREPVVFGQQYGDVRIVIHVTEGSWIQVRDVSGALLISQILHPGNSYRVPKQGGLTLMTGNAGALQFLVDGNLVPSIGPPGSVRRDVILDPDRLLAGTAVSQ